MRPTQLPSSVKNIDGSNEKKEESDSEIGNQEEGVVETREDSSETENVESEERNKNEGGVECKEEGAERKEEGVENKDDKKGVEDKEDAESKEAMNVEEEGKEEEKKKPETEIQASENVKTGGLPGKKKRKNVYFANVVNKHRRRRRGSRSRYDSKSTSESTTDSADSADTAELENENSTSPANSFFKIPKKPMALRKLSRYLRLLEPNENVLSNHTYELVLFTTADSQVERRSTMR